MSNSSSWPIDKTLSGPTTPGQSGPWSDGNEKVFCLPQSSSITLDSPSDCLMSYPGHSLEGFSSLTGLNSEFSFSSICCQTKVKEPSLFYHYP